MMTIDDEGEGGVLANDDVITETTFFGKFLGFFKEIFQNIPQKFTKSGQTFSTSQGNFY